MFVAFGSTITKIFNNIHNMRTFAAEHDSIILQLFQGNERKNEQQKNRTEPINNIHGIVVCLLSFYMTMIFLLIRIFIMKNDDTEKLALI